MQSRLRLSTGAVEPRQIEASQEERADVMKIKELLCCVGNSGYYNWDLAGLKAGATPDGFIYRGLPVTPGFNALIQPGEAISVMLILDDGQVAIGDCVDVILAGAAGRDPVFKASQHTAVVTGALRERLVGAECTVFRALAEEIDTMTYKGGRLHTGVRYGITQALLHASALSWRETDIWTHMHARRCTA